MWRNFRYDSIDFKRHTEGDWLVVTGEITNISGRDYNAVSFRVILFTRDIPIGNTIITLHGFRKGQTRCFEKRVEELGYDKVVKSYFSCKNIFGISTLVL